MAEQAKDTDAGSQVADKEGLLTYRINLVLFLLLALLLTVWFHRHLHLYVTEAVMVGGSISLWGLWKILQSLLGWGMKDEGDALARSLLARAWLTEYLVFGLVLTVLLYASTASVYLLYQGDSKGEGRFHVEVLENGAPYLSADASEVTAYQRVTGRPLFLHLQPTELEFRINRPWGYRPLRRTLGYGDAVHLAVPGDFAPLELHLLRLIPGHELNGRLRKADDPSKSSYRLELEKDGVIHTLPDLRWQLAYTGAAKQDLAELYKAMDRDALRTALTDHFAEKGFTGDLSVPMVVSLLFAKGKQIPLSLNSGDQLTVRVIQSWPDKDDRIIVERFVTVSSQPTQDVWIE